MTFQGATLHYLIVVTLQLKNQPGNGLLGHMKKSKVSLQHYDRLARYAIVLSYLGNRVFQQIWISNFLYLDCRILKKSLVVFKVKIKIRYLLKQLLLTVFIQWFMKSSSSWFWLSISCVCLSFHALQVRHYYYRLVRRMNKLLGPGLYLDSKNSKDTNAAMLRW